MQLLIDERLANGPFKDPIDLAERIDLRRIGKRALESMVKVGCFDEWGTRPQMIDALDRMIGHSGSTHAAAAVGQLTLFGGSGGSIAVNLIRAEKDAPKIDLVFFPKVWAACRELVQPNQILVVRGQVQAENEAISILVNSAQTKLTVAKDAAQARPLPAWDDAPPPPDWDSGYSWDTPAPANQSAGNPPVAEPPPVYLAAAADVTPPPPDEDEYWEENAPPAAELPSDHEALTPPDRAAAQEAEEPPPAPVVEMPVASDERRATSDEWPVARSEEPVNGNQPPMTNNPQAATNDSRPTTNGHSLNSNGPTNGVAPPPPSRILVVEIRASGNWKDACRQSVRLAERYVGNAGLRLQLAGQGLVMDFPDRRIECALDLVEGLERIPGVGRVFEL